MRFADSVRQLEVGLVVVGVGVAGLARDRCGGCRRGRGISLEAVGCAVADEVDDRATVGQEPASDVVLPTRATLPVVALRLIVPVASTVMGEIDGAASAGGFLDQVIATSGDRAG